MPFENMKSRRQVLDIFEDLFIQYRNFTELPKFKKRRLSESAYSKVYENCSNLEASLSAKNGIQAPASSKGHTELPGDASMHVHSQDQGSFSSGVFSIDSDIENPNDEDTPSEAGSGVVERSVREVSLPEEVLGQVGLNREKSALLPEGAGILTDDDVLFMMHKPRLKKKKKPPWQKRKLDIDDLWVKGQHLQSPLGSNNDETITKRLFLDRNLRLGKISLQDYICAMRKSRKGRKGLNNSRSNKSMSKSQSRKDQSLQDKSSKSLTSYAKLPSRRTKSESPISVSRTRQPCDSTKEKHSLKCKRKTLKKLNKSTRSFDYIADSTSEQEFQTGTNAWRFTCSFKREKSVNVNKSSVKKANEKSFDKSQETSSRMKATMADALDSKRRDGIRSAGRLKTSRKSRQSRGRRDSTSSNDNTSGTKCTSNVHKLSRTNPDHSHRQDQDSKTSSGENRKQKKDCFIPPTESSKLLCCDQWSGNAGSQESAGSSEESTINFISFTPRKSRKLLGRKHHKVNRKYENLLSTTTSHSSDSDGRFRIGPLQARSSLVMSDVAEWEDEEVIEHQSLFSRRKHCGGIWNDIVEEYS